MKKEKLYLLCKVLQRITFGVGVLMIVLPILFWSKIPDEIPSHYNAAGMADQYSDKGVLALLLFVTAFLMGIMSIAVYFVKQEMRSKYTKEAEKSQMDAVYVMLSVLNFVIQCMFAYIVYCSAAAKELGGWFLPAAMVAVFLPLLLFLICRHKSGGKDKEKPQMMLVEEQEEGISYRSKVDWWLGLLLGGSVILTIYIALLPILQGEGIQTISMASAVLVLVIVLPLFGIRYVFYSSHLRVSCGVYGKARISYASIRQVKETKNPLSSAAMSLDRLQIDYLENGVHKTVLISPVRKKEFMEKLDQYRKQTEV